MNDTEPPFHDPDDTTTPWPCPYCCEPLPTHKKDCPWGIALELGRQLGYIPDESSKMLPERSVTKTHGTTEMAYNATGTTQV